MSARRIGLRLLAGALALHALACQGQAPVTPAAKKGPAKKVESPAPSAPASGNASTAPAASQAPSTAPSTAPASPAASSAAAITQAPTTARLAVRREEQPADTWQLAPALQRARAGLAAGPYAGALAAVEGDVQPTLEIYDAEAGLWRLDESHSSAKSATYGGLRDGRSFMGAAVHGGSLYTAGGTSDLSASGEVMRWIAPGTRADLGYLRASAVAPAFGAVGERLVAAGGYDPSEGVLDGVTVFLLPDGLGDDGAEAKMPLGVAGGAGVGHGGKLWVFGGYDHDDAGKPRAQKAVQAYDPVKDTWVRDGASGGPAALPEARHSGAAVVVGARIFLVGGVGADGKPLKRVDVFDPASNAWSRAADLPTPRGALAATWHDGRLWTIGGFGADGRATTTVEVYRP